MTDTEGQAAPSIYRLALRLHQTDTNRGTQWQRGSYLVALPEKHPIHRRISIRSFV